MNTDTSPETFHLTIERILPHLDPSVRIGGIHHHAKSPLLNRSEKNDPLIPRRKPTPSFQIDRDQGIQQSEGTPPPPLDFYHQGPVSLAIHMHRRTRPPHPSSPVLKISSLKNETSPGQHETRIEQPVGGRRRLIPHLHEDPTSRLPLDVQHLKVWADIIQCGQHGFG